MSGDEKHEYPGKKLNVRWDGRLCIHVQECGRSAGELFVGGRKPWCQPDLVEPAEVEDIVRRCPTGALSIDRRDSGEPEAPEPRNEVVVSNRGPLYLRGDLDIDGAAEDMPAVRYRAALCRCGQSDNKPFCDNSHEASGFDDRGAVGERGEGGDPAGGQLTVRRAPNGPLLLNGNFSIVAASGRARWTGTKAALCRCGHSKNKPFCDGTHKAVGFTAD